jgi:hypothetical protein
MGPRFRAAQLFFSIACEVSLLVTGSVDAQPLPRSVTVAANPPGTVFYALASGLSKVASEGSPMQLVV